MRNSKRKLQMKKLMMIGLLLLASGGCSALYSPYDLHTWCQFMGSARLTSIGEKAHDPATCQQELEEDLADRTPRILYVPRDVVMWPVIGARATWTLLGMTDPPF
jgi:hypothetical protein